MIKQIDRDFEALKVCIAQAEANRNPTKIKSLAGAVATQSLKTLESLRNVALDLDARVSALEGAQNGNY
ncbi:hypothetical protein [Agarivorans sp. QJM3NY_25]|uniref:hypothetical protein n=1 Tax=Agarivorans sp. QJM3NY_25 TaxID=3421430 RepID=UPI003D7E8665